MEFRNLIERAKNNDEDALNTLFELYRPLIFKKATIDNTYDEDLFQELEIVFLRCIREFRG